MDFAPAKPLWVAAASSPTAAPKGASACRHSYAMARVEGLKTRAQFLSVAAAKRKWVAPGLILQAKPPCHRPAAEAAGLGFTVSRKVGNAVARNRAKRRLRAAAREVLPSVAKAGYDYVVIGRKSTLTRPYEALVADLRQAVLRLNDQKRQGKDPASDRQTDRELR